MNPFQPVQFRSVDEFLDYLPANELVVVNVLRDLIYNSIPAVQERLAYNVPFYYLNSRICFIWPAAVPWGKVPMKGVQLGFCKGYLLADELNYLDKGTRKQVYSKTFFTIPSEDDQAILKAFLFEAASLDRRKGR